ncbi:MAG: 2OG-Fe dioxygenase family protein [Acetobacteraceae bacterium]
MIEDEWRQKLRQGGFTFAEAPGMREALGAGLADWDAFAESWDDLGLDTYMADGGRYRKRRHAAFRAEPAGIVRKPHQPHYQSRDYNALNGGIARWFEPVAEATAGRQSFQAILRLCHRLFDSLTPASAWHVEVHQFRIKARPGQAGQPTPEGMHQDGVDWVLVLMVGRVNIAEGETSIHGLDRALLGSFTLRDPLDAALVDDHRVFHGVTPVQRLDPAQPAHRDVLVVTFRRES